LYLSPQTKLALICNANTESKSFVCLDDQRSKNRNFACSENKSTFELPGRTCMEKKQILKLNICFLILFFSFQLLFSQSVLSGRVVSEETGKPLASASVYLNNTSLGTITNEQGIFIIPNIPSGKFRLIASCVGFETYVNLVDPRMLPRDFTIVLKQKTDELQGFSVLPPEPDGWKKWGKLFTDIFIGNTPKSNDCKLMNPEVLKFRMNADNTLTAYANDPLQIVNYDLGYEIRYKLEEFQYDFNIKLVNYSGYAFFTDLGVKHPNRAGKFEEERLDIYKGSLLHFMRAFFANELENQGFEMRSLGNISNPEKDRAKKMFSLHKDSVIIDTVGLAFSVNNSTPNNPYISSSTQQTRDSTDYFKKMLLEPDSVISHQPISSDSIGFAADSTVAGFYFKDSLEVSYKFKTIPNRYRVLSKDHKHEIFPVSQFVFVNKRPIFILNSGYHYKPYDLKITGYWAWSENISTLLPFDYRPKQ
jgi:CarboxypepD_reg-like domain